jgi:hypothetical protein
MSSAGSSWQNPDWRLDEKPSAAARRAAARMVARERSRLGGNTASTARVLDEIETAPQRRTAPRQSRRSPARSAPVPTPRTYERVRYRPRPLVLPVVLFSLMLAGIVLVGPIFLNTAAKQADARVTVLEQQAGDLVAERAALQSQIAGLEATPRVKAQAEKMGMQPASKVNYVTLPSSAAQAGTGAGGGGSTTSGQ